MTEAALQDCRILIAEDEYLIATDLAEALTQDNAVILGPVPRVADALSLIESGTRIDLAVLDVNLCGDMAFPVADALAAQRIPFAFATGYDDWTIPARFANVPRLVKPFRPDRLRSALKSLLPPSR
ncbi:response regulator [Sphingobium sp. TA15]|uniref:CheY-like response regulator n=1 Tax=Sphingobium indicum (strain DSM 16413 / CCM 7287 / MTCC 6362 / UT26 / NBRC 101211 / UT26S) TaxID=452662 RepID=D4YZY8_SPHIU|nr:response regulator [Sphingobium indicum]BAI95920.1 CheY-like response regulator [Sphingobium indicum UT26S]BDD65233.1 response regulator [Sphingobium sp. TA15]